MEAPEVDFRTQIAEELTRQELIDRLCDYHERMKELNSYGLKNVDEENISVVENNTEAIFAFSVWVKPIKRTNMFKTIIEVESGNFVDYNFVSGISNLLNVFCKNK